MKYDKNNKLRVFTAFSGYDSQCLALKRLKEEYPTFDFECIGWSEIDKYACIAHDALFPEDKDKNYGDITLVDWEKVPDFDLFTYSYPCFVAGTLVLTSKGYMPIEEVKVGDYVMTKSGIMHKVLKTFDNGVHPTCKLSGYGFHSIHTTPNHKFWTRKKKIVGHFRERTFAPPEFVEAKDLSKNHYLGFPVNDESVPFLTQDTDFWYMMGMYIGDGLSTKYDNDIIITCNDKKLNLLCSKLDKEKWKWTVNNGGTCHRFRFSSKKIKSIIMEHFGTGSKSKRIPYDVVRMPVEQLQAFFDGYVDSDGYKKDDTHVSFTTVNENIAYMIQLIFAKLYKRPMAIYMYSVPETKVLDGRVIRQSPQYEMKAKTTTDKQDKAFYEDGYVWYPFSGYEECGEENVYNIEVEEDHSYVVFGAMVKNCQDISNAGIQKGFSKGSGTRSSLLWECERAVEIKRPKYLLMENVKALVQKKFLSDFNKWLNLLDSYGYNSYWQVLNSKDFGIPQNRERVFCISMLRTPDDPNPKYHFPTPFQLSSCLADVLDEDVDESFFLRDEMLSRFCEKSVENEQ